MTPLYKYIADPQATEFILNGVLKFTPTPELNDPSELVPSVIPAQVLSSLERLRRDGYSVEDMSNLRKQERLFQRLAPHHQAIEVPPTREMATATIRSSFYDDIDNLEHLLQETANTMAVNVGLFCLSRRFDSLPMWAHYAANATGVVVEFKGLDKVFTGDDTGLLFRPLPVVYERGLAGITFETNSHKSLFFSKFADWSYEEEVRVVVPLADCQVRQDGENKIYYRAIPKESISRIIVGWNASDATRRAARVNAEAINSRVEVVEIGLKNGYPELFRLAQSNASTRNSSGANAYAVR